MVKNPPAMRETWVQPLSWEDPLEEGMATHSSIFAWIIPWTEELGGLQSMGSQRVWHAWASEQHALRGQWYLTPNLPWEFYLITLYCLVHSLMLMPLRECWSYLIQLFKLSFERELSPVLTEVEIQFMLLSLFIFCLLGSFCWYILFLLMWSHSACSSLSQPHGW